MTGTRHQERKVMNDLYIQEVNEAIRDDRQTIIHLLRMWLRLVKNMRNKDEALSLLVSKLSGLIDYLNDSKALDNAREQKQASESGKVAANWPQEQKSMQSSKQKNNPSHLK